MAEKYSLVVYTYEGRDTANKALDELKNMEIEHHITLRDAVAVYKDDNGKVRLHQTKDLSIGQGALAGTILGAVVGIFTGGILAVALLGLAVGAAGGALDTRLKDKDMKQMGQELGPNNSALFMLVEKAEWEEVNKRLAPYKGRPYHIDLTEEDMKSLQEVASNEDVAAAINEEIQSYLP